MFGSERSGVNKSPATLLARPALFAAVDAALRRGLACIVAPAGYGKTIIAESIARSWPNAYVISASPPADVMARIATAMACSPDLIVLDDVHVLADDDATILELLRVVEESRDTTSWLIAGRNACLRLATMLSAAMRALAPIEAEELTFDLDDVLALAKVLEVTVSLEAAEALLASTGGWPAATAGILRGASHEGRLPAQADIDEMTRRYVGERMWRDLDDELRTLATIVGLTTSIRRVTLEAMGFSPRCIDDVIGLRLFVPPPSDGNIVATALLRRLILERCSEAELDAALARFARLGPAAPHDREAALAAALAANRLDKAADILAQQAFDFVDLGMRDIVERAVHALERNNGERHPAVLIGRAALYDDSTNEEHARRLLEAALRHEHPRERRRFLMLRLIRACIAIERFDEAESHLQDVRSEPDLPREAIVECEALDLLLRARRPEGSVGSAEIGQLRDSVESLSRTSHVGVLLLIAEAAITIGAWLLAADIASVALSLGIEEGRRPRHIAKAYDLLATIALREGRHSSEARRLWELSVGAAARSGSKPLHVATLKKYVQLLLEQGHVEEAGTVIGEIAESKDTSEPPAALIVARYHVALGDPKAAAAVLQRARQSYIGREIAGSIDAYRALCLVMIDRQAEAESILTDLANQRRQHRARRGRMTRAALFARFYEAFALWAIGRTRGATDALNVPDGSIDSSGRRAMMSAIRGIIRLQPSLASLESITPFLTSLTLLGEVELAELIRRLAGIIFRPVQLSSREIEVLRAFHETATTTDEVAKKLGRSKFTIQAQVQSAIRKIGCSGRAEAIVYARNHHFFD